jgi:hypothetical protein
MVISSLHYTKMVSNFKLMIFELDIFGLNVMGINKSIHLKFRDYFGCTLLSYTGCTALFSLALLGPTEDLQWSSVGTARTCVDWLHSSVYTDCDVLFILAAEFW